MYTPIQLEAIKLFGRKDLTEGCRIVRKNYWEIDWKKRFWPRYGHIWVVSSKQDLWWALGVFWEDTGTYSCTEFSHCILNQKLENGENEYEILWHIPHLEDVFRLADEKEWYIEIIWTELLFWNELWIQKDSMRLELYAPALPLLEQSEETLTQLIDLFQSQ